MISLIVITSLFIVGLHYSMQFDLVQKQDDHTLSTYAVPVNKEILWFVKYYLHRLLHNTWAEWMLKPLCTCVICMASIHGSVLYWANVYLYNETLTLLTFAKWPVVVLAVAGLNRLLHKFLIL